MVLDAFLRIVFQLFGVFANWSLPLLQKAVFKFWERKQPEVVSQRVCKILDYLGYSEDMVSLRRDHTRASPWFFNVASRRETVIPAGSTAEGFVTHFESDHDTVLLQKNVVCVLFGKDLPQYERDESVTVLKLEWKNCEPGYYRLILLKHGTESDPYIECSTVHCGNGKQYISSDLYIQAHKIVSDRQETTPLTESHIAGPALSGSSYLHNCDFVYAFKCDDHESLLSEWKQRNRLFEWPSEMLVHNVALFKAYLVPVGSKTSSTRDLEWRICFMDGERKLIDSLNEFQYKIYIILKMVNTAELKCVCKEITSYVMKNIFFWYLESNPLEVFTAERLLENTLNCLKNLRVAVDKSFLAKYMIPKRNLLAGRMEKEERKNLLSKLDTLIADGGGFIIRCPRILFWLGEPEDAVERGLYYRLYIEKLYLQKLAIWNEYIDVDNLCQPERTEKEQESSEKEQMFVKDPRYQWIQNKLYELLWPGWRKYKKGDRDKKLELKIKRMLS